MLAEYGSTTLVQRAFAFLGGIERLVAGARGQPFMVDSFTPRCPQLLQRLTGTHFRRRGLQYAFDIQHKAPLPAALHISALIVNGGRVKWQMNGKRFLQESARMCRKA